MKELKLQDLLNIKFFKTKTLHFHLFLDTLELTRGWDLGGAILGVQSSSPQQRGLVRKGRTQRGWLPSEVWGEGRGVPGLVETAREEGRESRHKRPPTPQSWRDKAPKSPRPSHHHPRGRRRRTSPGNKNSCQVEVVM